MTQSQHRAQIPASGPVAAIRGSLSRHLAAASGREADRLLSRCAFQLLHSQTLLLLLQHLVESVHGWRVQMGTETQKFSGFAGGSQTSPDPGRPPQSALLKDVEVQPPYLGMGFWLQPLSLSCTTPASACRTPAALTSNPGTWLMPLTSSGFLSASICSVHSPKGISVT